MDQKVITVLTLFYIDSATISQYHGRWDTWLIAKGHMDEYFYMMMKNDMQVANILREAWVNAKNINASPLGKVMRED